eukprot:Selendium_serpulae@DN6380_c4_g1_i1.p1
MTQTSNIKPQQSMKRLTQTSNKGRGPTNPIVTPDSTNEQSSTSAQFTKLGKKVWTCTGMRPETKGRIFMAKIVPVPFYGLETRARKRGSVHFLRDAREAWPVTDMRQTNKY